MADVATTTATNLSGPSKTAATQRVRLISPAALATHNHIDSLWVSYKGRVYDVTDFAPDHPGGDDLVLRYAGKDMGDIMDDVDEHAHSDSAYALLEEHYIGRLPLSQEERGLVAPITEGGADFTGKDESIIITDDFVPTNTDTSGDYKKHAFLDLSQPLIMQVWNAKFGKDFYLQQVHSPRHLKQPAQLFGPWYLEMFTRTTWYVVPLVWLPITFALFLRSAYQFSQWGKEELGGIGITPASAAASAFVNLTSKAQESREFPLLSAWSQYDTGSAFTQITAASLASVVPFVFVGIFIWTILEYGMHRFLFHVDNFLPDRPFFLMLHFLLHGIHHYLPMDPLRLVMPPILFAALSYPFTRLGYALFPDAIANGIICGAFLSYVGYDMMHYALHHTKLPAYIKEMKKYHLEHHYKNYEQGFGVTSRFWDWVFGTEL
jgi:4-hydroxysphinganine ceramide fatty acyl 2-hydroxylase